MARRVWVLERRPRRNGSEWEPVYARVTKRQAQELRDSLPPSIRGDLRIQKYVPENGGRRQGMTSDG